MIANNPMRAEATRKKVSDTLKLIKHKPKLQGGNGKPATTAEMILFTIFSGLGFVMQPAIKTGVKRGDLAKIPPSYKPDIGNFSIKLAIEADGSSHTSRRHLDAKKDATLRGLGWTVLRFTNQQILTETTWMVETVMSTILKLKTSTLTSQME